MNHHEHIYSKILTLDELTERLGVMRQGQQKPVVVFTNGCFDLVHRGHVDYLSRARDLGDLLVVGLNSDSSVRRLKGESRPISNESSRAAVLAAMGFVDYVVVFEEDTPLRLIENICPDTRPASCISLKSFSFISLRLPRAPPRLCVSRPPPRG